MDTTMTMKQVVLPLALNKDNDKGEKQMQILHYYRQKHYHRRHNHYRQRHHLVIPLLLLLRVVVIGCDKVGDMVIVPLIDPAVALAVSLIAVSVALVFVEIPEHTQLPLPGPKRESTLPKNHIAIQTMAMAMVIPIPIAGT